MYGMGMYAFISPSRTEHVAHLLSGWLNQVDTFWLPLKVCLPEKSMWTEKTWAPPCIA